MWRGRLNSVRADFACSNARGKIAPIVWEMRRLGKIDPLYRRRTQSPRCPNREESTLGRVEGLESPDLDHGPASCDRPAIRSGPKRIANRASQRARRVRRSNHLGTAFKRSVALRDRARTRSPRRPIAWKPRLERIHRRETLCATRSTNLPRSPKRSDRLGPRTFAALVQRKGQGGCAACLGSRHQRANPRRRSPRN